MEETREGEWNRRIEGREFLSRKGGERSRKGGLETEGGEQAKRGKGVYEFGDRGNYGESDGRK